ncbi:MAG: hypothetical protein IJN36_03660 [Clostridia bacterium]|nr:hypothetical protein [Clostridia bacterium]
MNLTVLTKNYEKPPLCKKEILRYAMCREESEQVLSLLSSCIKEAEDRLCYKVCYCIVPVKIAENTCDFGAICVKSEKLAKNLSGCEKAVLFSATVGAHIDRLIDRYSRIMPSRSLMMQAIGTERIEALCDAFCEDIKRETKMSLCPRFSPGYGDLEIFVQREIFSLLDPPKRIGVCLNDSMLMSPSKSVTAFVGVKKGGAEEKSNKCKNCNKKDCSFRGEV